MSEASVTPLPPEAFAAREAASALDQRVLLVTKRAGSATLSTHWNRKDCATRDAPRLNCLPCKCESI